MRMTPDGRLIYVKSCRIQVEEADALAAAIANSPAQLYAAAGSLVWLDGDVLRNVTLIVLQEIIERYLATPMALVNRGSAEQPRWEVEYQPPEIDESILRFVLLGRTYPGRPEIVSLLDRMPPVMVVESVPAAAVN